MTDGTTHYTRPDVAMFLAFLNAQEGPKMEELPPEAAREMFRVMGQMADAPRGEIAHVEDKLIPGPAGDIPLRIYDKRPARTPGPPHLRAPSRKWGGAPFGTTTRSRGWEGWFPRGPLPDAPPCPSAPAPIAPAAAH